MPAGASMRVGVLVVCAGLVLLGAAGCSSGEDRGVVSSTAVAFAEALQRGDGSTACGLLTSNAQRSASGATDTPCAKAITSIDEHGATVTGVQVGGDAAQVRIGGDVLFLRRISGAWRVSSAGCQPRPKGPYDCEVGG